eukprot:c6535_g1_i1.p1 GENE.c6535_g1_i1~~c6535_g1_i1.p1  ORF type:complete len:369 (+),score=45.52 c6535_g1_i1:58-1164(+)
MIPFLRLEQSPMYEPVADYQQQQDPAVIDAWRCINELQQTFLHFSKMTDERLARMESNISHILSSVSSPQPNTVYWMDLLSDNLERPAPFADAPSPVSQPLSLSATISEELALSSPKSMSPIPEPRKCTLQIVGLETRWYTKRPLTPFRVRVIDSRGNLFTDTEGYTVCVHLISGHEIQVDQYLANAETLQFPLVSGEADITGVRFLAVSSRNGGHFNMKFTVTPTLVEPMLSEPINVLSERLKNEHKAESILDLNADDSLARVPGIGKKYAAKLAEQGLHTVRDLARIDTSPGARNQRLDILNAVRRDRGALTEAKLVELLRDAKVVAKREDFPEPCAKRLKQPTEEPEFDVTKMLHPNAFEFSTLC